MICYTNVGTVSLNMDYSTYVLTEGLSYLGQPTIYSRLSTVVDPIFTVMVYMLGKILAIQIPPGKHCGARAASYRYV